MPKSKTRSARLRLAARREPYWLSLSEGMAVGYRKGAKGGTWIARHYATDQGRRYEALGTSMNVADADGKYVLSFAQAQEAARKVFAGFARQDAGDVDRGPYTVGDALTTIKKKYTRNGGKALDRTKGTIEAHIRPKLGEGQLAKLTKRQLEKWLDELVAAPPASGLKRPRAETPRARRKSRGRASATGVSKQNSRDPQGRAELRTCRAARWKATTLGQTSSPSVRRNAPKIRYLSDVEAMRLINAVHKNSAGLVTAALLTGCRYGELAAMKAGDFNPEAGGVYVSASSRQASARTYDRRGAGFLLKCWPPAKP